MKRAVVILMVVCLMSSMGSLAIGAGEKYPTRAITAVIPWSAGGMTDVSCRILAKKMEEVLDLKLDEKPTNLLLITINPKYIIRANISLINILLKENLKGIYICINHPSYLVDKLLRTHEIPTENLSYLDFITPIAGPLPESTESILEMDKVFSLGTPIDAMNADTEEIFKKINIEPANTDFIMVDNISNLITYGTQEKIIQFIQNLTKVIKKFTLVYGIIIMDEKTDKNIRQLIDPYFDNSVFIKDEWL